MYGTLRNFYLDQKHESNSGTVKHRYFLDNDKWQKKHPVLELWSICAFCVDTYGSYDLKSMKKVCEELEMLIFYEKSS